MGKRNGLILMRPKSLSPKSAHCHTMVIPQGPVSTAGKRTRGRHPASLALWNAFSRKPILVSAYREREETAQLDHSGSSKNKEIEPLVTSSQILMVAMCPCQQWHLSRGTRSQHNPPIKPTWGSQKCGKFDLARIPRWLASRTSFRLSRRRETTTTVDFRKM